MLTTKDAMKKALENVYKIKKDIRKSIYGKNKTERKLSRLSALIETENFTSLLEYISRKINGDKYE